MVLCEMIMLAREIGDRTSECHLGVWNKISQGCHEVRDKCVGIIGYGHVGSQLSVLCESLGMRVLFYDILPVLPLGNARSCNSMQQLLSRSDFVTLHVPGGPSTVQLIGAKEIACIKSGSYLLNASVAGVVDVRPYPLLCAINIWERCV